MITDLEEKLALAESRELTYTILGSAFLSYPRENQLEAFVQENLFRDFPILIESDLFQTGLLQLIGWADTLSDDNKEDILHQLKTDYTRLFIGPDHLLTPPWESVYLSEDKLTFGPQTLAVREFMHRHGLEYTLKNNEPDDHFGLELEFMAELVHREYEALEKEDFEQAQWLVGEQGLFLKEHLLKWAGLFTADVQSHAKTPYFQGMAAIANEYLNWAYAQQQDAIAR